MIAPDQFSSLLFSRGYSFFTGVPSVALEPLAEYLVQNGKYVVATNEADAVSACIGAYLGGRILRGPAFLRERRRGFILEWLVIVLATVLTVILHPGESGYPRAIVVGLLALAMGIQNALIREHGIPNLATNVMTLTLTGLLADPRGPQAPHRKRRQFSSIAIFVVSATVGAFLVRYSVAVPLLVATLIFTLALYWLIPARGEIRTAEPVGQ